MQHSNDQSSEPARKVYTRLPDVFSHIPAYYFGGQARLAKDAGYSRSTINNLIHGKVKPSYDLVTAIQTALDKQLGYHLPIEEWLSANNTWPSHSLCSLLGCSGCIPDIAYHADGSLKSTWQQF